MQLVRVCKMCEDNKLLNMPELPQLLAHNKYLAHTRESVGVCVCVFVYVYTHLFRLLFAYSTIPVDLE